MENSQERTYLLSGAVLTSEYIYRHHLCVFYYCVKLLTKVNLLLKQMEVFGS